MALPEILVFYEPTQITSKIVTSSTGAEEVVFWEQSPMTAVDFYTQGEILEIVSAGPPSVIVTPAEIGMYKTSLGAIPADTWVPVTHGLGNDTPDVSVVEVASRNAVLMDWRVSATDPQNVIEVYSDQAYGAGELRINVLGGINSTSGGSSSIPISVHPSYAGLELYFGPEPLPAASSMPNTIYFVIPAAAP